MIKVIKGVKYYPVSERIKFGLESMYEKAQYMMQCEYMDGKIGNDEYDRWNKIAEECETLMYRDWLSGKEYGRAKTLTVEREWMRYNRCIASGMSEAKAARALG